MAHALTKIRSLLIGAETTFSTARAGADYQLVGRAYDVQLTLDHELIERDVVRPGLGKRVKGVLGGKGGTLSYKMDLCGLDVAASEDSIGEMYGPLSVALAACGLDSLASTGTTIESTSSTTVLNLSSAANITAGKTVVCVNGEIRAVTAKSTNAITVQPALTNAPSVLDVVYASVSYFMTATPATLSTATFVVKDETEEYVLTGCAGTVSIESFSARGKPQLAFTFQIDAWTSAAAGTKTGLPTGASDTGAVPIIAKGGAFLWGSTAYATTEANLALGFTVSPKMSVAGAQGRSGWALTDESTVLTVKPYLDPSGPWRTDFSSTTERRAIVALGATGGEAFAISIPAGHITAAPQITDMGGLRGHDISIRANDSDVSGHPNFVLAFF